MLRGWLLGHWEGLGSIERLLARKWGNWEGANGKHSVVLRGYWDSLGDTGGAEDILGLFGSCCRKEFWRNRALRQAGRDWELWGDTGRGQTGDIGGAEGALGLVGSTGDTGRR